MDDTSNSLIQIVDDDDEPLQGASRSDAMKQGLRHRLVYALVWNQAGELLVQKRREDAKHTPGMWRVSAGGFMYEGERYDIAVTRKLAEELGLANVPLKDIATFNTEEKINGQMIRRVNKVFETEVQSDVELRLDADKIAEVKWLTVAEVKQLIADQPDEVSSGLKHVAERVL